MPLNRIRSLTPLHVYTMYTFKFVIKNISLILWEFNVNSIIL